MLPQITGDPTADKAIVDISAKLISDGIKKALSSLTVLPEWLKEKYKQQDPFGLEARHYAEAISFRYDRMRVLGMSAPVPIRSIYVRVNILEKITSRRRQTPEEMEDIFNKDKNSFGVIQKTADGIDVANREQRLIVLGKPGAGKTTFLKWLTLCAIDGRFKSPVIPIFISLKDWSDSKKALNVFILEEFSICGFDDAKIFVDQLFVTGNALLLLDGLDEVGGRIDEAIREVQNLSTKYPKIKLFVSCRAAAYNYVFPDFKDVEIADFSDEQVNQFVQNWFRGSNGKGESCINELGLAKNKAIANLCSTPLLLTLLCLAFDDAMAFPPNRAELYKDALDALLKKWDSSRAIVRESSYKSLSLAKKELLLSRLAFNTFSNNRYFIKQAYLEGEIADFVGNLKSVFPENSDIEGERVLKEIESQHGLLVERAHHVYSFSHLTFQEFFTARYITENTNKDKGPNYLISNHLGDFRWNEVFILTTGLLAEADAFLMEMRKKLSLTLRDMDLLELLTRLREIVTDSNDVPEPVRRTLAVYYVTNELAKTQSNFRAAYVASKELLTDMQKEFGRISNLDFQALKTLRLGLHQHRQLLANTVADIKKLRTEQIRVLAEYIRGTRLLVNCLNVDAYVTAPTRNIIVKSIFHEPWINIESVASHPGKTQPM